MKVPRGTARAFRRASWANIRTKVLVKKPVLVYRFDANTGKMDNYVKFEDMDGWKPTFAEFTRKELLRRAAALAQMKGK